MTKPIWDQIALDLKKDKRKSFALKLTPGQKLWVENEAAQRGISQNAVIQELINKAMGY